MTYLFGNEAARRGNSEVKKMAFNAIQRQSSGISN